MRCIFSNIPEEGRTAQIGCRIAFPEEIKSSRSEIFLEMERTMSARYRRSFLGKDSHILEKPLHWTEKILTGHTPEYVRMAVPVETLGSDESGLKGMFVTGIGTESE